jgi:cobalt-zinc-cadmium efflux system outer membrane protein
MKLRNSSTLSHQSWWQLVFVILTAHVLPGVAANATNDPAVTSHTLESLVTEALEKNPELKFYESEIAAAKAGRRTAGAFSNPELSGSVGTKSVKDTGVSAEGVAWSVSVMQPFEWPGRIGLRKAIANHEIELAQLGYARFKVALAGRVRTLGYRLWAAQEKAATAAEVAGRFRALREVLVQRDPAGLTPLLETRVIEATELNAQRKASDAMLVTQGALLELNHLRGVDPNSTLSVTQAQFVFLPLHDRAALIDLARTNNFELKVRAVELAQQGFRLELAKNERYPAVAVGPTVSEERAGDRERIIGLGVSLPLPLWNRNSGNIGAAASRRTQAEVSFSVVERELQRQILEAALTYETKVREMENWRPDSIQHFQEAAEVADRHYRLGAVPISTYVELQKQYLEAVEGLLDTRKEALEAAARLELLAGLPPFVRTNSSKEEEKP